MATEFLCSRFFSRFLPKKKKIKSTSCWLDSTVSAGNGRRCSFLALFLHQQKINGIKKRWLIVVVVVVVVCASGWWLHHGGREGVAPWFGGPMAISVNRQRLCVFVFFFMFFFPNYFWGDWIVFRATPTVVWLTARNRAPPPVARW